MSSFWGYWYPSNWKKEPKHKYLRNWRDGSKGYKRKPGGDKRRYWDVNKKVYQEKLDLMSLMEKGLRWLNMNFNNLSDDKKLYVAMEIIKKRLPLLIQAENPDGEPIDLKISVGGVDLEERRKQLIEARVTQAQIAEYREKESECPDIPEDDEVVDYEDVKAVNDRNRGEVGQEEDAEAIIDA